MLFMLHFSLLSTNLNQKMKILKGDLFHRPDLHRLQRSDTGTQNYQYMASIIPHVDMVVKHMDLYSEMLIKRDV